MLYDIEHVLSLSLYEYIYIYIWRRLINYYYEQYEIWTAFRTGKKINYALILGGLAAPQTLRPPEPLQYCTMAIVNACAMAIVHACTMAIAHACAMAIVHACTMAIAHAFTMAIVQY